MKKYYNHKDCFFKRNQKCKNGETEFICKVETKCIFQKEGQEENRKLSLEKRIEVCENKINTNEELIIKQAETLGRLLGTMRSIKAGIESLFQKVNLLEKQSNESKEKAESTCIIAKEDKMNSFEGFDVPTYSISSVESRMDVYCHNSNCNISNCDNCLFDYDAQYNQKEKIEAFKRWEKNRYEKSYCV